jgi:hypothetical protein
VVNKYLLAGKHKVAYEFNGLPSGIYFARIKFNNNETNMAQDKLMKTMKLLLIK